MSIKRITVIGIGTLGGALCKNISEMESIDELIIVDYDTVESKNVHNSIYNVSHIGEKKVDALKEIISNNIHVISLNKKYKEGKTKLPKCDLIIDCRDVVCDRDNEIDVRLYITGNLLIFDCRKNIKTKYKYEGSYRRHLTKSELNKAGFFASQILCSNQLKQLRKNQSIQKIDLNLLPSIINKAMNKSNNNRVDIIYEGAERLQCIEENIYPIMKLNKNKDIRVFVGEKQSRNVIYNKPFNLNKFLPVPIKEKYSIIPKESLKNSNDLIKVLSSVVSKQHNIINFIVTVRKEGRETFVELLEETGAA